MKESIENYLETILILIERKEKVRAIDVVKELGFSKPSVSIAIKKMKNFEYITVDDFGYISFTQKGEEYAQSILERHRIISEALLIMGVSEEVAQGDACKIEHVLSDETFEKLKSYVEKVKGSTE